MQMTVTNKVTDNYAQKHDTGAFKPITSPLYITGALAGLAFRMGASLVTRHSRSWEKFNTLDIVKVVLGTAAYTAGGLGAVAAGASPLVVGAAIMVPVLLIDAFSSSTSFLATKAGFRQIAGYRLG